MAGELEKIKVLWTTNVRQYQKDMSSAARATTKASQEVQRAAAVADKGFSRAWQHMGTQARATARSIQTSAKSIKGSMNEVSQAARGVPSKVTVEVKEAGAEQTRGALGRVGGAARDVDGTTATVEVEQKGGAATTGVLKLVQGAAERLDGRHVAIGIGVLGGVAAAKGLSMLSDRANLLNRSAGALRANVLALAPALGPVLAGAATAASAATLALGAALVQAGAGFAIFGGAAAAAVVGGLAIYRAALTKTIADTREAWVAANEKAAASLEKTRQAMLLTPEANAFNESLNKMILALTGVEAKLGQLTFPTFTNWMNQARQLLPQVTDNFYSMVSGVTAAADSFVKFQTSSAGMERLNAVLRFISVSTQQAAQTAVNLGNSLSRWLPFVVGLSAQLRDQVFGLVQAFTQWSNTQQGAQAISAALGSMFVQMQKVWNIATNLGQGLAGIFSTLSKTGVGQALLSDLERLMFGFGNLATTSTKFERDLAMMAQVGGGVLRQLAGIVGEAASQFWTLAKAGATFRAEGEKQTVLTQIFTAIRNALAPLSQMMLTTFKELGPVLPGLITNFAGLGSTFLGFTPVFKLYLESLNNILSTFNNLPDPIKNAVASFAALGTVMGQIGGTNIAGLVGGLAAARMQVGAVGLAAGQSITPMGAFGASFAGFGTKAKAAATGMLAFLNPAKLVPAVLRAIGVALRFALGPWGLLITGVVAGTALIISNWGAIKNAISPVISALSQAFTGLMTATEPVRQALGSALTQAIQALVQGFTSAIPGLKGFGGNFTSIGNAIRRFALQATPVLIAGIKGITAGVKAATPTLQTIGKVVGTFLVTGFRIWGTILRVAVGAVKGLVAAIKAVPGIFQGMTGAINSGAKAIGKFVQSMVKSVVNTFKNIGRQAGKTWQSFWNRVRQIASSVGKGISKAVGGIVKGVVNTFKNIGRQAGKTWQSFWNKVGQLAQQAGKGISKAVGGVVKAVVNTFNQLKQQAGRIWSQFWNSQVGQFLRRAMGQIGQTVKNIPKIVGQAFNQLKQQAGRIWSQFWNSQVGQFLRRIMGQIGQTVKSLPKTIVKAFNQAKQQGGRIWNQFWNSSVMKFLRRIVSQIAKFLKNIPKNVQSAFNQAKKLGQKIWNQFWNSVRKFLQSRIKQMGKTVTGFKNSIVKTFKSITKPLQQGWSKMWAGIEKRADQAVKTVKGYLSTLAHAAADVLAAFGLKDLSGKLDQVGNSLGGGGKGPKEKARGGVERAQGPTGGVATSPRVVYGEAGSEAYVTLQRYTPESARALGTSIQTWRERGWMGRVPGMARGGLTRFPEYRYGPRAVPSNDQHGSDTAGPSRREYEKRQRRENERKGRRERRRRGGSQEGYGPTMYDWIPEMQELSDAMRGQFDVTTNTYSNHPPGFAQPYYRERSMDTWGGGGRGDPIGDIWPEVSDFGTGFVGGALNWVLNPGNDPAHWNHVHITAFAGTGTQQESGGSGSILPSFDYMGKIEEEFGALSKGPDIKSGFMAEQLQSAGKAVLDAIKDWIVKKAQSLFSKVSSAVSGFLDRTVPTAGGEKGQAEEWVRAGYKAAAVFPDSESNIAKTLQLAWQESGWNPTAVNPISVGGEHATGFLQMLPSTFQAYIVKEMTDILNAVHNTAASLSYQSDRYGSVVSNAPYARGGIANMETGDGGITRGITGIAGEAGTESIVPHHRRTPEGRRALVAANRAWGMTAMQEGGVVDEPAAAEPKLSKGPGGVMIDSWVRSIINARRTGNYAIVDGFIIPLARKSGIHGRTKPGTPERLALGNEWWKADRDDGRRDRRRDKRRDKRKDRKRDRKRDRDRDGGGHKRRRDRGGGGRDRDDDKGDDRKKRREERHKRREERRKKKRERRRERKRRQRRGRPDGGGGGGGGGGGKRDPEPPEFRVPRKQWPPKQDWNFIRKGAVSFDADPEVKASAKRSSKLWGKVLKPGQGVGVHLGVLKSGAQEVAYTSGHMLLSKKARASTGGHGFGHFLGLGHGGNPSIMNRAREPENPDWAALEGYYKIGPGPDFSKQLERLEKRQEEREDREQERQAKREEEKRKREERREKKQARREERKARRQERRKKKQARRKEKEDDGGGKRDRKRDRERDRKDRDRKGRDGKRDRDRRDRDGKRDRRRDRRRDRDGGGRRDGRRRMARGGIVGGSGLAEGQRYSLGSTTGYVGAGASGSSVTREVLRTFARGGVVPGQRHGIRTIQAHGGERVLSHRQTQSFEHLVGVLRALNNPGAPHRSVHATAALNRNVERWGANSVDGVARGDAERSNSAMLGRLNSLEDAVDHQTDVLSGLLDAMPGRLNDSIDRNLEHRPKTRRAARNGQHKENERMSALTGSRGWRD